MTTLRWIAAMLLVLVLPGCSMSVFESLPPGEITRCAPTWPGYWARIKSPGDKPPGKSAPEVVEIDASCSKPGDTNSAPLALITTPDGRQYIEFLTSDGRPQCQPGKDDPNKKCGHLLLRYEYTGDEIRVYDVDHARLASLIGKQKIREVNDPDAVLDAGIHLVEGNNIFGVMVFDLHEVAHLTVRALRQLDANLHIDPLVAAGGHEVDLLGIILADIHIVPPPL